MRSLRKRLDTGGERHEQRHRDSQRGERAVLAGGFEVGAPTREGVRLPKVVEVRGRPRDYSPKARFLNFLGFKLPFDRHDWIVDRCGTDVRYVIDFYNAKSADPRTPVAMHLDARPALDSIGAVWDRFYIQGAWTLSGEWLGDRR